MIKNLNFIALDFETATGSRNSICEVGLCLVIHGEIIETRSWLVRPPENRYWSSNIRIHGIRPSDTENAPDFDTIWEEIERLYLDDCNLIVAHNAVFDRSCLHSAAELYRIHLPQLRWACTLRTARRIYSFRHNNLEALCLQLGIPEGTHHRAGDDAEMCARLYIREISDAMLSK